MGQFQHVRLIIYVGVSDSTYNEKGQNNNTSCDREDIEQWEEEEKLKRACSCLQ